MKRILSLMAVLVLCLSVLMSTASAANQTGERIDYEDGSYAIITTGAAGLTRATCNESKTYTYYNPSNQRCFSYTLYASFTYNGITSSADYVNYNAAIYRQGWDILKHNEYTSGKTAYGSATFTGPTGTQYPVSLSLTCDKDGNVT